MVNKIYKGDDMIKYLIKIASYILLLLAMNNILQALPCGDTTNCPKKKYPYSFCNADSGYQITTFCVENPNDPSIDSSLILYQIWLPFCVDY